jgi:hypothetical protein
MTVPIYPTELPPPNRSGFQFELGDGRRRTRPEAGPPRVRRKFSSAADQVALVSDLTRDQYARLARFWRDDTAGGSLPFLMPDPTSNGWPLLSSDGLPLLAGDGSTVLVSAWWLCIFGERPPAFTVVGLIHRTQFTVAVMP